MTVWNRDINAGFVGEIQNLRYEETMRGETGEAMLVVSRKTGVLRVILISIMCGSVRLNFTSANGVIKCVVTPLVFFFFFQLKPFQS